MRKKKEHGTVREVRQMMRTLDTMAKKHTLDLTRYVVKKWDSGHRVKARLLKQKRAIRQQMREVNAKLRG